MLDYLNKWYDFKNSEYSKLSILSMKKPIMWNALRDLAIDLKINFDEDKLNEDFCILREAHDSIFKSN